MPASRWSEVAPELQAFFESIDSVGLVYPYMPRYNGSTDDKGFKKLFSSDGKINFLVFRRIRTGNEKSVKDDTTYERQYALELLFFYAWAKDGASELSFQDITDDIVEACEAAVDRTLGGTALTFSIPDWETLGLSKWFGEPIPALTSHFGRAVMVVEVV